MLLYLQGQREREVEVEEVEEGGKRRERVNVMGVKCLRVTQIFPSTLQP